MKTQYTIALAMLAGAAIGAAAVQGLHAQAKPPAFIVAEINVTNEEGFLKEFAPLAQKALSAGAGYKVLARGGKTVSFYGDAPKSRVVINTFENLDAAVSAYNSAAYKEAKAIGDKYATFRIFAVEGQ
ncbi:MAG TPA: DUF1330 domain-containing protein [Xanthobacteraceae bacterium]|nr:DUF1330 domain-containing protein [Xanthobacteraceae bacterium]